jgi:hypothetical protein
MTEAGTAKAVVVVATTTVVEETVVEGVVVDLSVGATVGSAVTSVGTVDVGGAAIAGVAVVDGITIVVTDSSASVRDSSDATPPDVSVTESRVSASTPGTRITTGDPSVTSVPAAGTCSTTVSGMPSRPSTRSTTAGDPMVDNTPAANWTVLPTTEGTSVRTGSRVESNNAAGASSPEQAATGRRAVTSKRTTVDRIRMPRVFQMVAGDPVTRPAPIRP